MASVRQIAKDAGVSISTVSRVLNNDSSVHPDTRTKVLAVANEKGYTPSVGRRVTTHVALAYTQEMTISHPYDATVIEGITRGLDERGFDLVILNLHRDKRPNETYTQFFIRKGVRGVILRTMKETRSICNTIADEGFPHVVISERFEEENVCSIDCDSKPDSIRAVEYLIGLGHERIAFGVHNVSDLDHLDRYYGYVEALTRNGIEVDEGLIFRQPFTIAGGAAIMNMAMGLQAPPTAFYFADPLLGIGAVKRAHELGIRIPEDVSIVGFDDTDIRYSVWPTMTAVCQKASTLGLEAALWLTRMLTDGPHGTFNKSIPTFFEVYDTTGPVPKQSRSNGRLNSNKPHRNGKTRIAGNGRSKLVAATGRLEYDQSPKITKRKAKK